MLHDSSVGEATEDARYLVPVDCKGDQSETLANGCLGETFDAKPNAVDAVASQVWMHAMGGREGVIDTACKTSETGCDAVLISPSPYQV